MVANKETLKVFRLEPKANSLEHYNWEASIYKGHAIIRAATEEQARDIASCAFGIAVAIKPGRDIAINPWGKMIGLVTCNEINDLKFSSSGEEEILFPSDYDEEWR